MWERGRTWTRHNYDICLLMILVGTKEFCPVRGLFDWGWGGRAAGRGWVRIELWGVNCSKENWTRRVHNEICLSDHLLYGITIERGRGLHADPLNLFCRTLKNVSKSKKHILRYCQFTEKRIAFVRSFAEVLKNITKRCLETLSCYG